MNEKTHLDLFSGIGGFALAAKWNGYRTVGFCDNEPYAQAVLKKHWPEVPCHQDIREVRGVRMWPTPRAVNPGSRPNGKGGKILEEEVRIAEGLRIRGEKLLAKDQEKQSGSLNPTWVEWLMGYPIGHTDLKDWVMPSSRKSRQKSSDVSTK